MKVRKVVEWDLKEPKDLTFLLKRQIADPYTRRRLKKLGRILISDRQAGSAVRSEYFEFEI